MTRLLKTALMGATLLAALPAQAESRLLCVYDPAGKSGHFYATMEAFATDASAFGPEIELKAYTDEETAAKDYEAKQCDGVVATGVRLQRFNKFSATIEAIGALPTYGNLKYMVKTLTESEGAAKKLKSGDNETVGFLPAGAVYLFMRDYSIDTVPELAGKRIATMDYDKAAPTMVDRVGAIMVAADLGSIGPKFNNGDVDICYMSAAGYKPFELYKGLGSNGGVLWAPLAQATLQVMVRPSRFPEGWNVKARKDLFGRFDAVLAKVKAAENEIPNDKWISVPDERQEAWNDLYQEVRIKLRDDVGAYDGAMLSVMREVRCASDAARSECAEKKE